ncbi:MAG: inorganic pyrophosphatase [Parvicellaceae bacterium]|jgi:inorganic pyrophosphatase
MEYPCIDTPNVVTTFIEITPFDTVKYEIDKESGYRMVDRPQKFSNIVPALHGFIPQTYCGDGVADLCMVKIGRQNISGDKDPLDVLVLTERPINQGYILLPAIPIGGFRMIDNGEADDKIIAVLKGDEIYSKWEDLKDYPENIIDRLKHYFLTYKDIPNQGKKGSKPRCEIAAIYGKKEAHQVIKKSQEDYMNSYGDVEKNMSNSVIDAIQNNKLI